MTNRNYVNSPKVWQLLTSTDTYTMENTELRVVQTHAGLGVIVTQDSKTTAPYLLITSKGFETL